MERFKLRCVKDRVSDEAMCKCSGKSRVGMCVRVSKCGVMHWLSERHDEDMQGVLRHV